MNWREDEGVKAAREEAWTLGQFRLHLGEVDAFTAALTQYRDAVARAVADDLADFLDTFTWGPYQSPAVIIKERMRIGASQ